MARRNRRGRPLDGILIIDKPLNVSSHGAVQWCKRLSGAAKAGHTGSLDPKATGMLPICFGEATKFGAHLLDADKQYLATARFGARSTTGDAEGELIDARPVPADLAERLPGVLERFRGPISQVPPMYSAIKRDGVALYQLAREGVEVERPARQVVIHRLELLGEVGDEAVFRVHCSKGTYIRSLVEDIGEALGCGAWTAGLHREWVSPFQDCAMHDPEALQTRIDAEGREVIDAALMPLDAALMHLAGHTLRDERERGVFCHGNPLPVDDPDTEALRVYSADEVFLGIGEYRAGQLRPKRLIARAPDRAGS